NSEGDDTEGASPFPQGGSAFRGLEAEIAQLSRPLKAPNSPTVVIDNRDVRSLFVVVVMLVATWSIGKVLLVHPSPFVRVHPVQGVDDPCQVESGSRACTDAAEKEQPHRVGADRPPDRAGAGRGRTWTSALG